MAKKSSKQEIVDIEFDDTSMIEAKKEEPKVEQQ
jgi:hypothetical protein